jgi:hypothetical protein
VRPFATCAAILLIGTSGSACAGQVRVDVSQLLNDNVALRGVSVATVSSNVKVAKWTVSVSQSYLKDKTFTASRFGENPSVVDLRQQGRRGFQDMSVSAQRSFPVSKVFRVDLTMASTVPMGGPFGTNRLDNSGDAMVEADFGSSSYWMGVTQHLRAHVLEGTRKALSEIYAGTRRDIDRLTSLRGSYYHAQSDELGKRSVTNLSLSLNRDLPSLGSMQLNASRSKNSANNDWQAGLTVELDRLPF